MARMIPSFVDDHTPPGERDVFGMLAAGPADWAVLHSLDLAPWNRGLRTEIDFVVIIPDSGIICIEVKSQPNITFNGSTWYPAEIKRSPFKQAADGCYTFYRRLRELAPRFAHVPIVHCCIFPRARFDLPPNLSVKPWELMDIRAFQRLNNSDAFCADLKLRLNRSVQADAKLHPLSVSLSVSDSDNIVENCVPVQKRRPDLRDEICRREEQAASVLNIQQKPVLQLAELNDRLLVTGGAGTGKTLIAMEIAQRAAERGRRVGLLCFNQLVGDWMCRQIALARIPSPNLVVGRAIRVMAEMTGVSIPESASSAFWETDLPQQLESRLAVPDLKAAIAFDYLILDEAQDLLGRPRIWKCLSQFLHGGVESGAFAIFGDFANQVMGDRQVLREELATIEASARPVRWHLSENCRNYEIVGETAVRLAGLPASIYSGYLRVGGGLQNYDIVFFENDAAQLAQLRIWMREFKLLGYKPSEITLLSFRSDELSAATRLRKTGEQLRAAWQPGHSTAYASVHAFKGLENKIIILTDVTLSEQDFDRDVFYTGMTRATECIRVLCDKESESVLVEWLTGK
jgi:hypothetical protein